MLEMPFPSPKREENGQKDLGLLSLCFCFCFLWAKPTSYHMSKMAGGASSWPALSWTGFWKRGQKAARQLSRGISTPGSDPDRSPCFGLITYLGSGGGRARRMGEAKPMPRRLLLHVGAIRTQMSKVSEITASSSSIVIQIDSHPTGHGQFRQNRTEAPGDFGVRLVNTSPVTFPCEGLGGMTGLSLRLLLLAWGPIDVVYWGQDYSCFQPSVDS